VLSVQGQTLRWTAAGSRGYRIYENPPGVSIYVTHTTFTPTPQPGETVSYKVAATHKKSRWSNTVTISYRKSPPPLQAKEDNRAPAARFTPQPLGVPGNWTLKFNDEFEGTALDRTRWVSGEFWGTGNTTGEGIGAEINRVCSDSANVTEPGDGYLHLKLSPQQNTCNSTQHDGTETTSSTGALVSSATGERVTGHVGFQYTYGYVEWRAYLNGSSGQIANWPGLWSVGCCHWPHEGEIDTLDAWSPGHACWGFHSDAGAPTECPGRDYTGWHTFGSDWRRGEITYYYDGVRVGRVTLGVTSAPQYLIMNIGAHSPGEAASGEMLVDYVRLWQEPTAEQARAPKVARTRCF